MRRCDAGVSEIHAQRRRNDAELRERKKPTVGELLRLSLEGWLLISKPTTSRFNHHFIFTRKKKLVGRRVPSPPTFGVTVNFTLPFSGAVVFTSTLSELNPAPPLANFSDPPTSNPHNTS
jgi:hypothetical protein